MARQLKITLTDEMHNRLLADVRESGARTVNDYIVGVLQEAGGDPPETRSEVINAYGPRVGQSLIEAGISTVTQAESMSDEALLAIPGFGQTSLAVVREHQGE